MSKFFKVDDFGVFYGTFCNYRFNSQQTLINALDITPESPAAGLEAAPRNGFLAGVGHEAMIRGWLDQRRCSEASHLHLDRVENVFNFLGGDSHLGEVATAQAIADEILIDHAYLAQNNLLLEMNANKIVFGNKCRVVEYCTMDVGISVQTLKALIGAVALDSRHDTESVKAVLEELGLSFPKDLRVFHDLETLAILKAE